MPYRLEELPDDILFLILARLDSARDLRALALSCRALYQLVRDDGWRIFVKSRFPSLSVPAPSAGRHAWQQLAESLTWQSRCWDRRSLQFQVLLPHHGNRRGARLPGASRGLFLSVVDAHLDVTAQRELVVWGAGEDIIARYRTRRGGGQVSETSWHRSSGKELGLSVGYDDIKAIKIVKHGNGQAIVTGRHNGQLSLLSADPDRFGQCIAQLGPPPDSGANPPQAAEQGTINSLDLLDSGSKRLLAAATRTAVRVYGLPEGDAVDTAPLTTYDLKDDVLTSNSARLGRARWMEQGQSMAVALVGCKDPLRYLSLTPSGWSHHAAAKSAYVEKQFGIKYDRTICPNSLEPVHLHAGAGRGTSLLLSSWRDGTIRLQDLRTPSPFDAVYQDNVDPWSNAEALMAYGTERFLAGGGDGLTIKIFDFRWTKNYYHTTGLPCLDRKPFPRPHQPFLKPPTDRARGRARCDHVRGRPCHWHDLSRRIYYRPNAKYFLSESVRSFRTSSVWSLARPSDVSPNLYVGISGGVIEAALEPCPDAGRYPASAAAVVDPHFGFADWRAAAPPGSGYRSKPLIPALMEIGDGYSFKGNDRSILLPSLLTYQGPRESLGNPGGALAKHHRLDNGYHHDVDFLSDME